MEDEIQEDPKFIDVVVVLNGCMVGDAYRATGDIVSITEDEFKEITDLGEPLRIRSVKSARKAK